MNRCPLQHFLLLCQFFSTIENGNLYEIRGTPQQLTIFHPRRTRSAFEIIHCVDLDIVYDSLFGFPCFSVTHPI